MNVFCIIILAFSQPSFSTCKIGYLVYIFLVQLSLTSVENENNNLKKKGKKKKKKAKKDKKKLNKFASETMLEALTGTRKRQSSCK